MGQIQTRLRDQFRRVLMVCAIASMPVAGIAAPQSTWMELGSVLPSQQSIGLAESMIRSKALEQMTALERREYLEDHPVSVVHGPGGKLHLVDGHHVSWALLDLASRGIMEAKAPAKVLADLSSSGEEEFWRIMRERNWVWLYDSADKPIQPADLPLRLRDLKDDRHRSLAWLLREEGCFEDLDQPFQEFYWARYLRKKVTVNDNRASTLRAALLEAKALAHGEDTVALPGYLKQHAQNPHTEISKKNRRRIDSLESGSRRR